MRGESASRPEELGECNGKECWKWWKIHPCRQTWKEEESCHVVLLNRTLKLFLWTWTWRGEVKTLSVKKSREWAVLFYHFHPFFSSIHLFPFFFIIPSSHLPGHLLNETHNLLCLKWEKIILQNHIVHKQTRAILLLMMAFISTSNMENANHHASRLRLKKNEY